MHTARFQVSGGLARSRHLFHRWCEARWGRWPLLCHPLIKIIKLSQPAAHKWGISAAPPSCGDSLQIASDSPPDCAMIMLSLDAVIMMACNCWCALAAARQPTFPDPSVDLHLLTWSQSINLRIFHLSLSSLLGFIYLYIFLSS